MKGDTVIMSIEIERKFLVDQRMFDTLIGGNYYVSGYLNHNEERLSAVKVTHRVSARKGSICFKGNKYSKCSRKEFETSIDEAAAVSLLSLIPDKQKVEKKRIHCKYDGNDWAVDVFDGLNKGLVMAELEIPHEEYAFRVPEWIITEVTDDPRYYGVNLAKEPYSEWAENDSHIWAMNNEGILTMEEFIKMFQVGEKVYFSADFAFGDLMIVSEKDIGHYQYVFKSTSVPSESFILNYYNIYNPKDPNNVSYIYLSSADQNYKTRNFIVKEKEIVRYNNKHHEFK